MPILIAVAFTACIDEDLSKCGINYRIDYTVRLRTNLHQKINSELTTPAERVIGEQIEKTLNNVFTDITRDVDLSFYTRHTPAHHEQHRPEAGTSSFTVYLPVDDYRHYAIANSESEPAVTVDNRDSDLTLQLSDAATDTVDSHSIGLFTANFPITIEQRDQVLNVDLYMKNCATALVIDNHGHTTEEISGYVKGMAGAFNVYDSTFIYRNSVLRTRLLHDANYSVIYTAGFPSPNTPRTKGDEEGLWQINVYVKSNGKYTESVLHIHEPLEAGDLKIIKAHIGEHGEIVADTPEVGVSVTLDWKPGGDHNIEI